MKSFKEYIIERMNIEDTYEAISYARSSILSEFFSKKRKKGSKMSWTVVPFARLKKIWEDYSIYSVVRDEKGIEEIVDIMLNNLARLQASTELSGHTQQDPNDIMEEEGFPRLKDGSKQADDFYWNFLETDYGTPISDYGLNPLWKLAEQLTSAQNAEQKLVIIDQMLNICHQRGDLAALFIEGGTKSLSQLSGIA